MADDLLTGENQNDSEDTESTETSDETTQETTETQNTDENQETDGDSTEESESTTEEVPEEYEAFTMPEGMEMDSEALELATPLFKDLGLSQEQGQKVADVFAQLQQKQGEAFAQTLEDRNKEWVDDLAGDKEIGGERLDESSLQVVRMFKTFDTDGKAEKYLSETGQGNCAPIFKMLARISTHFKEDSLVTDKGGKSSKSVNEKMGWKNADEY